MKTHSNGTPFVIVNSMKVFKIFLNSAIENCQYNDSAFSMSEDGLYKFVGVLFLSGYNTLPHTTILLGSKK